MSLAMDRMVIAHALDGVDGITGYDSMPTPMNVGDAWVRWGGFQAAGPALTFTVTWRIVLVGGITPEDAMGWVDSHLAQVLDAIGHLVYVQSVEPVEFLIANSGAMYGAEIIAEKEN